MRRIGFSAAALIAFLLAQGCSTTNRNQLVIEKPGMQQAAAPTAGAITVAPNPASSKGGSAATPGTVAVDLTKMAGQPSTPVAQPTPAPVAPKKEASAPKPAPAKKQVAKTETKPAAPAAKKVVLPAPTSTSGITISPYSSKGGSAVKPGLATLDLSKSTGETQKPVAKIAPAPAKKEVKKAEAKPAPKKEAAPAPKKEAAAPKPAPAKKEVAKAETKPAAPVKKETKAAATSEKAAPKSQKETAMAKPGQSLGAVRQVNGEYKFIVIEFDSDTPLPVGTPLQIWRNGKLVGKAKLDEPLTHWPLAIASVVDGDIQKDDSVKQ